jgi:hypothetical protein
MFCPADITSALTVLFLDPVLVLLDMMMASEEATTFRWQASTITERMMTVAVAFMFRCKAIKIENEAVLYLSGGVKLG